MSREASAALAVPGARGGARTCGVHRGGLAPGAGAPHVEGAHVDGVALPGLQLHQGLAGGDAHDGPGRGSRAASLRAHTPGPSFLSSFFLSLHGDVKNCLWPTVCQPVTAGIGKRFVSGNRASENLTGHGTAPAQSSGPLSNRGGGSPVPARPPATDTALPGHCAPA